MAVQLDRGRLARDWIDWLYDTIVRQLEKQAIASGAPTMPRDLWRDAGLELTEDRVLLPKSQKIEWLVARSEMVAETMYRRPWQLVRLPKAALFTGDQPVSFFNHDVSAATSALDASEIRWPLDRSTALILGPPAVAARDSVRHGTDSDVESINHSTADWSYEWIFDHPEGPTNSMVARWLSSTTEAERDASRAAQAQRRWASDDTLDPDESTRRSALKRDLGLTDSDIDDYRKRLGGTTAPRRGRNEPCWCGSGKKHKYCHGR